MPYAFLVAAALLAAPATSVPASLPGRYMPVSAIQPGMKGIGKSVFKGTAVVDFQVEVLGVLKNIGPKRDLILVRCSGQDLETSGVIAGMSGSPIYIDGKLIGALAYSWRYAKAPIAGITPIEEMLEIGQGEPAATRPAAGTRPAAAAPGSVHRLLPAIEVDGRTYGRVRVVERAPAGGAADEDVPALAPIATPVTVSGAKPETFAQIKTLLARSGCLAVQAGGLKAAPLKDLEAALEPGAVCAVSLVTGDIDMTAFGTITDRVGDTVWAFGHPFNGDGAVEMPLWTGAILAIMPSQLNSFKFGVALKPVGRLTRDEFPGIRGEVGPLARTVPLTVRTHVKPRKPVDYRFALVRHPDYTPSFLRMVLAECFVAQSSLPPECTVTYEATLEFAGRPPIRLGNVFDGSSGAAAAIQRVALTAMELLQNDIQKVELDRASVTFEVEPTRTSAAIESLRIDTPKVKPGGEVVAQVVLLPYRGEREIVTVRLAVPKETPEGTYSVTFCDARSALRIDLQARPHRLEPRTLDDLFAVVAEQLDNRKVYARLTLPDAGVAVEGRELPRLPGSALRIFGGSQWSGAITPVRRVIGAETATKYVVEDSAQGQVEVTLKP